MGTNKKSKVYRLIFSKLEDIAGAVAEVLLGGGVCIIPTDTIYGIVALDRYPDSIERVKQIKKRPENKPFLRLIGSLETLKRYTPQQVPERLKVYWPGPLTIIFRDYNGKTIALRWPDYYFLKAVFRLIGNEAIVAPSANISGEPPIFDEEKLVQTFGDLVDLIVISDDVKRGREPSTIIDITKEPWSIVREGAVKIKL